MKIEILEFDGKAHINEFIDWLNIVECIFDTKKFLWSQKVKLVAIKLILPDILILIVSQVNIVF